MPSQNFDQLRFRGNAIVAIRDDYHTMPVTIEHGIKRLGNCVATMPERTLRQEAAVFAVEIDLVLPVRIIGQPFEKVIEISISQAYVYSPDSGSLGMGC